MVCRYCGKPIAGTICAFCNKQNVLSYTSYELDDILRKPVHSQPLEQGQHVPNRQPDQSQLQMPLKKALKKGKSTVTPWDTTLQKRTLRKEITVRDDC